MSQKTTEEPAWLLDVNALIALLDPGHIHHESVHRWFSQHSRQGWATCAITENGAIRVMSQPRYSTGRRDTWDVIKSIHEFRTVHAHMHHFLSEDISLSDEALFQSNNIAGPKQVTDAYLLGLAAKHNARLVSFDRSLPWHAIRGATSNLVANPL